MRGGRCRVFHMLWVIAADTGLPTNAKDRVRGSVIRHLHTMMTAHKEKGVTIDAGKVKGDFGDAAEHDGRCCQGL